MHAGDQEPLPDDEQVLQAWVYFHRGEFQQASELGALAGLRGASVTNKATCIYANYLEPKERNRLSLFQDVAERAGALAAAEPDNANAFYWYAYALGHYSQGISVAKALAQGLGGRVKSALEKAIVLQPRHADAHIALGAFHADVIDKVGTLIANMTYGAKRKPASICFEKALSLTPQSANARVRDTQTRWSYWKATSGCARPRGTTNRRPLCAHSMPWVHLDVEMAQTELAS